MQIKSVQTYLAKLTASYFSDELETKISIDRLEVEFFNSISLHHFYVEDQAQDTLAYFKELDVSLLFINTQSKQLHGSLDLSNPVFNLYKSKNSEDYNLQFITDYFSSSDTSSSESWSFKLNKLNVSNGRFHQHNYNESDTSSHVNYDHLDIRKLFLRAVNVDLKGENIYAQIDSLSLYEDNGFNVKSLSTDFTLETEVLEFKDLLLQTYGTELSADIRFTANSFSDYSDFTEKVHLSTEFRNSLIDIEDLSFFVPVFEGIKEQVYLDGKIVGPVSNLDGKEVEIQINRETMLRGDFDLRGLPDVENTYIYLDLIELKTSANGLRQLPYPPFKENNHLDVPQNLDSLGGISFRGNFSGYYNDFVAYGLFSSSLGSIRTDLSLKEDESSVFNYKGSVKSSDFELGSLLQVEKMGSVSIDLEVNGKGISKETISAQANGKVRKLNYSGYLYRDIILNGKFSNQQFNGKLKINDENLALDFNGTVDARPKKIISDFTLAVQKANLAQLNLFNQEDSVTQISFKADFNLRGSRIDEIEGVAEVDSIVYVDSEQKYRVDSIDLNALNVDSQRKMTLNSSLLDAEIIGEYKLDELGDVIYNMVLEYIPESKSKARMVDNQEFELKVKVKNSRPLTGILIPELSIDSSSSLRARFNSRTQQSRIKVQGKRFKYNKNELTDFNIEISSDRDSLQARARTSELILGGLNTLDTVYLKTNFYRGELDLQMSWKALNKKNDFGQLKVDGKMSDFDKVKLKFYDSYISIRDSLWYIDSLNHITIDKKTIEVKDLNISNGVQAFNVGGRVSEQANDSLRLKLEKLNLAYVSGFLPPDVAELKGVADGELIIKDVYKDLSLIADLQIQEFELNRIDIGKAYLKSEWQPTDKSLIVDGRLGTKSDEKLSFKGKVYPQKESESLDLTMRFQEFPLQILSPYINEYLTDLEGEVDGKVKISGTSSEPLLKGKLQMNQAGMTVNYLNTHYTVNDELIIEPDFIGFNNIQIKDIQGNTATATGTIFHENYSNLNLDVGLEYQNFIALNTNSKNNDLYYGKAICSGNANISGFADQLIININATAQKGTNFSIPLGQGVEVSNSDFLIFTNSPEKDEEGPQAIDLSGIQLNFDLEIEPEAKVKIIFDEQIGDILEAEGSGNLKLEINTLGNFNIYGQYVISDGEYLFTLKNIVNKRFQLAKGSRISWDGDPYRARIDMQAIYNLRASLIDIMPNDSSGNFKGRVPVELELQMTGFLLSPEIAFDIRIPTADDATRRRLESILYVNRNDVNQQEMNQQVFGLLVFNRFMPPSTGTSNQSSFARGAPGVNNGYEFISNQMSNWLSQLSDRFDVGVNYRQGNQYTSDEVDVSLSTELFEDRLVLDGNVGYSSQNNQVTSQDRSNFIGEFSAEYKLSRDGRFRVKGFNRSTNNSLLQTNSPYTQGVGLFYREEFDTFNELWRRYFGKDSKSDKSKGS